MTREALISKVSSSHVELFGAPATQTSLAPGRVNLLGEHTDYNDGFVLPVAIDFYTCVCGSKNESAKVSVCALDFNSEVDEFEPKSEISPSNNNIWKNYIRGAFYILKKEGYPVQGCELTVSGNIPKGAGLSSSASLEVAVLNTLSELFELGLGKSDFARMGQKIENEFVGLSCGIMDQLSSAFGQDNHALMIDCRDQTIIPVPMPPSLSLLIVNSNVERQLAHSGYNDRRRECDEAANLLGVKSLRDVSLASFLGQQDKLPPIIAKRAEHVLTENARVIKLAAALGEENRDHLSELMSESHNSMKNLFEITTPEIDFLVEIISHVIGNEGGVRMTGGGFGGSVIAILPSALIDDVKKVIGEQYEARTGLIASIYSCQSSNGVQNIVIS